MDQPSAERPASMRPVLAVWVVVGTLVTLPYASAALRPPDGRTFVGTFHWIDDFHNYVSFVQQAEDGRFLLENKLLLQPHPGSLVNLEWWVVGGLSRICGRRPFLAYRVFGLAVLLGLLFALDRALRRAGLAETHRLPALALAASGGGLGGVLFELTERPPFRCGDLAFGFFPFLEALANPHWLAGTWLLLEALLAFDSAATGRRLAGAVSLGTILGLVRPYDLVLLGLVHGVATIAASPPREWLRRALPLVGLLPVAAYNFWAFYLSPTFRTFGTAAGTRYASPPATDLIWAFGPAAVLALASLRERGGEGRARRFRAQLWLWAAAALSIAALQPVGFSTQFAIGAGTALLVLAAVGVAAAAPPAVLALTALLMSSSALVTLRIALRSDPHWHVPAERREAALALRRVCRAGDIAIAPADIGLYVLALTSCRPFVSHSQAPGHAERDSAIRRFYTTLSPAERLAFLNEAGGNHLLLPGDAGAVGDRWLGPSSPFRQIARVGNGPATISVYTRER